MKNSFLMMAAATALALGAGGATAAAAAAMSGGGVSAATPYAGTPATVSDTTPAPGQVVTVSGGGFTPNSTVTIVLDPGAAGLGSATASANGVVSATVTIPASSSGARVIVLSGTASNGSPFILSVAVNVGAIGSDIPSTGSDALPVLLLAIGATGAGAALWGGVSVRRRRPPVSN